MPGAIKNQNQEFCSNTIVFQKGNFRLSSETIIKNTKLASNQIIFINPKNINNFEIKGNLLSNKDFHPELYIVCGICDVGKTKLQSTLLINNITTLIDSNIEDETLCVIYPKY